MVHQKIDELVGADFVFGQNSHAGVGKSDARAQLEVVDDFQVNNLSNVGNLTGVK